MTQLISTTFAPLFLLRKRHVMSCLYVYAEGAYRSAAVLAKLDYESKVSADDSHE